MNELQIFKSPEFGEIRTVTKDGQPWFVAADVCRALEISNNRDALSRLDVDEKGVALTDTLGGKQEMQIVNEPGLYALVLGSRKPEAKQFKRWITHEVIQAIRKHGGYLTPDKVEEALINPDTIIRLATSLKAEREKNVRLQTENVKQRQIIGELKPKADYTDIILNNHGLVTITQIAKDYGMSGRQLNRVMADFGVQYKQSGQWLLYSKYHGCGYTHSQTIDITRTDGRGDVVMETKWTQKGRLFVYELLKKHGILPLIEKRGVI